MVVLNEFHFRLLKSSLDDVKANGGKTDCDDMFSIDGTFISSLSHGIQGASASAIEILGSLKALDAALCALSKTAKNSLSMAREELLPAIRHHGIYSLPLEVVSHIFQQVHVDDAKCATESIPLVNHYFHEIAIGTPGLWTHLTTSQNPTLFIERSKPLGLNVDLTIDPWCGRPHYMKFLEIAVREVERWTSLSIPYDQNEEDRMSLTRDVLAGKTFTVLRELSIGEEDYHGSLTNLDPYYSKWEMPSLRIIKSDNILPGIQPASLMCLHLHVGISPWREARYFLLDLNKIGRFLQSLVSLTELSLDFGWFEHITFDAGPETALPNVKTLRLRVRPRGGGDPRLTDFLASLRTPYLSELFVDINSSWASRLDGWCAKIFPSAMLWDNEKLHWPPLERLDLTMSYFCRDMYFDGGDDNHPDRMGTEALYGLFVRIPTVRHLSIKVVNIDPPNFNNWNVQQPGLRTLSFRDCNKFDTDFILGIKNIYKSPEFETLIIHNCKEIDTDVVREMMPEGKTLVSTVDWSKDIVVREMMAEGKTLVSIVDWSKHYLVLERFLDHVKANGGQTDCDDVLTINGKFISSLSHGMQGAVGSAIETLSSLKALDTALCWLYKTAENSLSMAREELLPVTRHHGIYSLPLEVVSHIFQQVHVDDAKCATESIPLVNHYFHEIAIGTPGLWTHLTTSQNPTLFIERSKPLGLDVDLTINWLVRPHYRKFLEIAVREAERWISLSIPYGHEGENRSYMSWTRDVLAGKTLTALRELRRPQESNNYYVSLEDFDSIYSKWEMPSLRIIKSDNILPGIQPASLMCLHLHVGISSWREARYFVIDLNKIGRFLQSLASLTELSLDFGWFRGVNFHAGPETALPNVKTLRLRVRPREPNELEEGDPHLTDFLASLLMPYLSELFVDIESKWVLGLAGWCAMIFPRDNQKLHWPPLERLDLTMSHFRHNMNFDGDDDDHPDRKGTEALFDQFAMNPTVRHLSISAGIIAPPNINRWNVQQPGLRTLSFRDCNKFDTDFILGIKNIYKSPEFETLTIHNCKKIDTDVVREMMPEGKTLVSTVDWSKDILAL